MANFREMELASILNTQLPEADEKLASESSAVHGLLTPLSSNSQSPHIRMKGVPEEITRILEREVSSNLLKDHVRSLLPLVPWAQIEAAAASIKLPVAFSPPEWELLVTKWIRADESGYAEVEEQCFARDRRLIHRTLASLDDQYGAVRAEVEARLVIGLEICKDHKLFLLSDVATLCQVHESQVVDLVAQHFPPLKRRAWLDGELRYLNLALESGTLMEHICRMLFLRHEEDIRRKMRAQRRLIQEPLVQPLSAAEAKFQAQLERLIADDLTAGGLKACFGDRYEEALQILKDRQTVYVFTKTENHLIREYLRKQVPREEVVAELVLRSEHEIDTKIKDLEVAVTRQTKFKNNTERLIYEAQWIAYIADTTGRRLTRKHLKDEVNFRQLRKTAAAIEAIKPEARINGGVKVEGDAARRPVRRRKKRRGFPARAIAPAESQSLATTIVSTSVARKLRSLKATLAQRNNKLIEEARYFQSITGDGGCLKEGEKRKRRRTEQIVVEHWPERKKANIISELLADQARSSRTRSKSLVKLESAQTTPSPTSLSDQDSELSVETLATLLPYPGSDVVDEELVSPYDPRNIIQDTEVPLNGRVLYNDAITLGSVLPATVHFTDDILNMLLDSNTVPIINTVSSQVIRAHLGRYNSFLRPFPPLEISERGKRKLNPRNIVHVRYLLYPQHTEQFILANPKSNELDPVGEIKRLFQIHYALYFSHSEALRDIIYEDYCMAIREAAESNNFAAFMTIIDKWNLLMLELSPYPVEIDISIDINGAVRFYLPRNYSFNPTMQDLKLDTFYFEIVSKYVPNEGEGRPLVQGVEIKNTRFRHLRPMAYSKAFVWLLSEKTTLSRYCVQQILLRAYCRIVSPDSRKLRSYKAFTAEVYGELLPSFVSEVFTKVALKPLHKFYDLGSGVGNTTFQAALEFGVKESGGCEMMEHASHLTRLQRAFLEKQLQVLGLGMLNISFVLDQSFVDNEKVRQKCVESDVLIVNNYLFDFPLNVEVGKLLHGLKPGSKIISLKNFIPPRYKAGSEETVFDYLKVEKHEMSENFSVSWTGNKVPYYISTVQAKKCKEYF